MINIKQKKGFGLIEIVISISIISVVFSSIFFFFQRSLLINQRTTSLVQSNMLIVEGIEVLKFLRDDSWSANIASLATSTNHFLLFTGAHWEIAATSTPIDSKYTRSFVVEDVFRDVEDDVADSGTYDADIKKITMSVSWQRRGVTATEEIVTYITNFFDN